MPDPKLAPGGARSRTASLDDSRAAAADAFALVSILSSAVGEVRLFEANDSRGEPLIQIPLPTLGDLLPALDWLLSTQAGRGPAFVSASVEPPANEVLRLVTGSTPEPELLALGEWLQQSARGDTDRQAVNTLLNALASVDAPPDALASQRRMALAWMALACAESAPTRPATLDLLFDALSGSCRAELSATPEPYGHDAAVLRGEDLATLRRNAARHPPPEPSAPTDLPPDAYLTAAAAARHLRVAKSTVTRRIAQNRLIGFRAFTRALRIPKDQFDGDRVVPGVADVLALFTRSPDQPVDHRAAWAFLNSHLFRGAPDPRPIDRLRSAAAAGTTSTLLWELARSKESLDRGDHF